MQLTENHSGDPQAMATRSALIECLSSATAVDLLGMLDDEPLFNLATRYFERFPKADMAASPSTVHSGIQPVLEPVIHSDAQSATEPVAQPVAQPIGQPAVQANDAASPGPSRDRIKRPLNGFMAFRRYYMRIFPDVPQKAVSGFLTMLWNQDPFRNKWVLIAKVYSFIRDEIGKEKIPLAQFLGVCCPIMRTVEPADYLATLGWQVDYDNGGQSLVRSDMDVDHNLTEIQSDDFPTTEFELLSAVLEDGYLPDESAELMERMGASSNPLMASTVPCSVEKLRFLTAVDKTPSKAAKSLLGHYYDDGSTRDVSCKVYDVATFEQSNQLAVAEAVDQSYYPYTPAQTHMDVDDTAIFDAHGLPDPGCYDVGNPYEMNAMMSFMESAPEYNYGYSDEVSFSAHNDFQLMF